MKTQITVKFQTGLDGIHQAKIFRGTESNIESEILSTMWSMPGESMEHFFQRVTPEAIQFAKAN